MPCMYRYANRGLDERMWVEEDKDGDETVYWFHVLSQKSTTYKKIDSLLVSRYNSLLMGEKPRGLTRLESFIDVMNAIHVVQYADQCGRACPPCNLNPCELVCTTARAKASGTSASARTRLWSITGWNRLT